MISGHDAARTAADGIFIGTHYEYPFGGNAWRKEWRPNSPDDWRKDLVAIRDTGFNLVRVRIGFDSNLDDTQTLLDLAHELGLKVGYGFAAFYAPDWFTERFPEARVVTTKGEVLGSPRDRRWPRACIEHEAYRKLWRELLSGSAQRFKDHPAIVLWDAHNEPSHECYCDLSKQNFKAHLETRYGDIGRLNAAWRTDYADFEACTHIPVRGEGGPKMGAESHYGAWRLFQADVLSAFLREGFALIRDHVKDSPVTYNIASTIQAGSDWWTTRESDVPSLSAYWGSDVWTTHKSVRLALLAGINPGRKPWVLEALGGMPPKPFAPALWTGKHLELETWSYLGRGVGGVVQYRWEPILAENETLMFGMVEVDNDDTEKRRRMIQINRRVRELEPFLQSARTPAAQVSIYHTRETDLRVALKYPDALQLNSTLPLSLDGWYGLLSHAGFTTAMLCEFPAEFPKGQVLVVPTTEFLSDAEWAALELFMLAGGRAVLQMPTGDAEAAERVSRRLGLPFEELEARAGLVYGWALTDLQGRNVAAAHGKRVAVKEAPGVQTLARFHDNDRPALIEAHGGRSFIATFDLGSSYDAMLHRQLRAAVAGWITRGGSEPRIVVEGILDEYRPLVEVSVLEGADRALIVCCNRSAYEWDAKISVAGYLPVEMNLPPFEARQAFAAKAGRRQPRFRPAGSAQVFT